MPSRRFALVDVFTDVPLTGNQLAVFTDGRGLADETMQRAALEMGFSESVFVLPPEGDGDARIRIFTPRLELPFAGHPTLGTAFVLGAPLQRGIVRLETGSGTVPVVLDRDASGAITSGSMEQPLPAWAPFEDVDGLLAAVGVGGSELPVEVYDNGARHVFVTLPDEAAVAALRPDYTALGRYRFTGVNCVAGSGSAWKLRMFSPDDGIGEDAATGSAAGPLACHLARHGLVPWGTEIAITQGVEIDRPSLLRARADGGEAGPERVVVSGSAVVVGRGELSL
jgi:trans-2,3-dihydro-3-hydroxyanthranilate isomerase